jgi:energy-converting hydrogenase Eha subunit A
VALIVATEPDKAWVRAVARHLAMEAERVARLDSLIARKQRGAFIDAAGWAGFRPVSAPQPAALVMMPSADAHMLVAAALDAPTLTAAAPIKVRWLVGPLSPAPATATELQAAMVNLATDGVMVVTVAAGDSATAGGLTIAAALEALGVPIVRIPDERGTL